MIEPLSLSVSIAVLIGGLNAAKQLIMSLWKRLHRPLDSASDGKKLLQLFKTSSRKIQEDFDAKHARLGIVFEKGDAVSRSAMTQILIDMNEELIDVIKKTHDIPTKTFAFCTQLSGVVSMLQSDCSHCCTKLARRLQARTPRVSSTVFAQFSAARPACYVTPPSDRLFKHTWSPEPQDLVLYDPKTADRSCTDEVDNSRDLTPFLVIGMDHNIPPLPEFHAPSIQLTAIRSTAWPVTTLQSSLEQCVMGHAPHLYDHLQGEVSASLTLASDAVLATNLSALGL